MEKGKDPRKFYRTDADGVTSTTGQTRLNAKAGESMEDAKKRLSDMGWNVNDVEITEGKDENNGQLTLLSPAFNDDDVRKKRERRQRAKKKKKEAKAPDAEKPEDEKPKEEKADEDSDDSKADAKDEADDPKV